ncbi:hypothetical protein [Taibaiella chishuiensis]|uniref:Lipoprotein n=1 Tax=Taibaiella chishuiensis TaxID=1434707 RepID=A0A2P8D1B7_9BACT|nr:hypothetical protein [Taibaiella chishuiensis]PSK91007.1 hypothetical protein B0I18_10615 [Taibaiella chishuiensis]
MMKYSTKAMLILILCTGFACVGKNKQEAPNRDSEQPRIGYRDITDEMAGSSYRTRARSYFLVRGTDTSAFSCMLSESRADSSVLISVTFRESLTYDEQLNELKLLLPVAATDFDLKRLDGIGIGRLITTGDLAVRITQQYRERFGDNTTIGSYAKVALFLKQSPLGTDFNTLLQPYGYRVDEISVEKVFFSDKQVLYKQSVISTDADAIPERILDCMTWIRVEPAA